MKLIIGLGNPGEKFQNNRHNVGHAFIDKILNSQPEIVNKFKTANIKILKTNCFMNDSGEFVKKLAPSNQGEPEASLYIVHDDLDIGLGNYKIQFGKGPQVHYGIKSIEEALRTKDFWRIRIGVDNRDANNRTSGQDYVLQDFLPDERETLQKLFPSIADELIAKVSQNSHAKPQSHSL